MVDGEGVGVTVSQQAARGKGHLGVRGVQTLLTAAHLEHLVELNVSGKRLDEKQVHALRKRFGTRARV